MKLALLVAALIGVTTVAEAQPSGRAQARAECRQQGTCNALCAEHREVEEFYK